MTLTNNLQIGVPYLNQRNEVVIICEYTNSDHPFYRCGKDLNAIHYYSRICKTEEHMSDNGRVTGTEHGYSDKRNIAKDENLQFVKVSLEELDEANDFLKPKYKLGLKEQEYLLARKYAVGLYGNLSPVPDKSSSLTSPVKLMAFDHMHGKFVGFGSGHRPETGSLIQPVYNASKNSLEITPSTRFYYGRDLHLSWVRVSEFEISDGIFLKEGDIVKYYDSVEFELGVVVYRDDCFFIKKAFERIPFFKLSRSIEYTILGNRFTNPELLKVHVDKLMLPIEPKQKRGETSCIQHYNC